MKGYALFLKGTQYDWCDQNKVLIKQGKKKKVLTLSKYKYQLEEQQKRICSISEEQGNIIGSIKMSVDQKENDERLCLTLERQERSVLGRTTRAEKITLRL